MRYLEETGWEEIFNGWRQREAENPEWVECAIKVKGWPDWESWRRFMGEQIRVHERIWTWYEIDDPLNEIPAMLMGPFQGWQTKVEGHFAANSASFADLVNIPEQDAALRENAAIASVLAGLPFSTDLIGLRRSDTGRLVVYDGSHRATAWALAQKEGRVLDTRRTQVRMAVAELGHDELALLDEVLKRGTHRL